MMNTKTARRVAFGCLMLLAAAGCGSNPKTLNVGSSDASSPTTTAPGPISTSERTLPPIEGMTVVAGSSGPVGYVSTSVLKPTTIEGLAAINAKTLMPVTDGNGTRVGYFAPELGFVPLAEADAPGFDVEALRAQQNGGCEPQIGNGSFKQAYPLCPTPAYATPQASATK